MKTSLKVILEGIGILILIILIVGGILWMIQWKNQQTAAVIVKFQNLNRWETASYTIEKIIDIGDTGNALQQFLFGDKILLIAHGEVTAGFDMSTFSKQDITVSKNSVVVQFPKPQIFDTFLDESQTKVYDRSHGIFVAPSKDLETQARQSAATSIRQAACSEGILQKASDNAKNQATALLSSFGFKSITITILQGSC